MMQVFPEERIPVIWCGHYSFIFFGKMKILRLFNFFSEVQLDDQSSASLLCVQCKDAFQNAWDLMVHAQAAHMLNIYELGVPNGFGSCSSRPQSPRGDRTPDKVRRNYHFSKCVHTNPRSVTLNDITHNLSFIPWALFP